MTVNDAEVSTFSPVTVAAGWLDEHLRFTVPIRMLEVHSKITASASSLGRTYEDRVLSILRDAAGYQHSVSAPASTLPTVIATMGDTLFGQSKPGRASQVAAAMTTAIACAALIGGQGITFRGQHWCAQRHEDCPSVA